MSSKKLSQLHNPETPLTGFEFVHVTQNGEARKMKLSHFWDYVSEVAHLSATVHYRQIETPENAKAGELWWNPETGTLQALP